MPDMAWNFTIVSWNLYCYYHWDDKNKRSLLIISLSDT